MEDRQYNVGSLRGLITHDGWREYIKVLQDEFDRKYANFRKISTRSDVVYGRLQGRLDGLEYAQRCIIEILNEVDNNPSESTDGLSEGEQNG